MRLVRTLLWLRVRLFFNTCRTGIGALNAIATLFLSGFMAVCALGAGVLTGLLTLSAVHRGDTNALATLFPVVFGSAMALAFVLPIVLSSSGAGFTPRKFLRFPVKRLSLFGALLTLSAAELQHLLYVPMVAALYACGFLATGKAVLTGLVIFALFMLFTLTWALCIRLLLRYMLRNRRVRELFVVLISFLFISICFAPECINRSADTVKSSSLAVFLLDLWPAVSPWIPSMAASRALSAAYSGTLRSALRPAGFLLILDILGLCLGYVLFRRQLMHPLRAASGGKKRDRLKTRQGGLACIESRLAMMIPARVAAVWFKDLRYILRSALGKLNILLVPVIAVFVLKAMVPEGGGRFLRLPAEALTFMGLAAYTAILISNILNNAFAWDGSGIRAYFFTPVPGVYVLLGKNLGAWTYATVLYGLLFITLAVLQKLPGLFAAVAGSLIFLAVTLVYTIVGNYLSILFPKKNDISSWKMSAPSNTAMLLSFLTLSGAVGLVASAVFLPALLGHRLLALPLLSGLVAALALLYAASLKACSRLLLSRRETLLSLMT